jgi:DNA polymerase III epsilon subunit-like protein
MISTPIHLNGSLLCAIDTSTTGLTPGFHEITRIAIIPLMADWEVDRTLQIFEVMIQPQRTQTFNHPSTKMSYEKILHHRQFGLDPSLAADLFMDWFKRLGLPERKKITPVGFNYKLHDLPFIKDWLGPLNYDYHFDWRIRDVLVAITFVNDLYDHWSFPIGFPKYALGSVCKRFGLERPNHHPINDALAAAQAYKKLFTFIPFMGSSAQLQPDEPGDPEDVRNHPDYREDSGGESSDSGLCVDMPESGPGPSGGETG